MASDQFRRIILCRESTEDDTTLSFLSVEKCLRTLQIEPHRRLDFVLALMLGGNDFVPAIECLKIRDRGWESIHSHFKQTPYPLSTDKKIRWDNLKTFVHELAQHEKTALQAQHKRMLSRVPQTTEDVYNHGYFNDPSHPLHALYGEQSQKSVVERDNYYEFIIGTCQPYVIEDMCVSFVASVDWCWEYYVHGVIPSWEFHYPFIAAPRLEDVHSHYDMAVERVHHQRQTKDQTEAYTPVVQLLCVLPKNSSHLLPSVLRDVVCDDSNPLELWYIDQTLVEPITGQKMIYSNSFLPDVETNHARVMVDVCSHLFTADETRRNLISVP
jgi:5'-3' exonuclease